MNHDHQKTALVILVLTKIAYPMSIMKMRSSLTPTHDLCLMGRQGTIITGHEVTGTQIQDMLVA